MRPGYVPKYNLKQKAAIGELMRLADLFTDEGHDMAARFARLRAYLLARNPQLVDSWDRKAIDSLRREIEDADGMEGLGKLPTGTAASGAGRRKKATAGPRPKAGGEVVFRPAR